MIRTRVSRTESGIKNLCRIALQHRLYVPNWRLKETFRAHLDQTNPFVWGSNLRIQCICIAFENDIPVGVGIVSNDCGPDTCQMFVRKAKRRQGFGTRIVKRLKSHVKKEIKGHNWCRKNGQNFFIKTRIMSPNNFSYATAYSGRGY